MQLTKVKKKVSERIRREKIKREEDAQRGKVDNVTHFTDLVKRFGDNVVIPEEYRQAVFERLACC
jgi:hypothetical protein